MIDNERSTGHSSKKPSAAVLAPLIEPAAAGVSTRHVDLLLLLVALQLKSHGDST